MTMKTTKKTNKKTTKTDKPKKKRLVIGRDFDAYAFQWKDGTFNWETHHLRKPASDYGKWVRVKFVGVD